MKVIKALQKNSKLLVSSLTGIYMIEKKNILRRKHGLSWKLVLLLKEVTIDNIKGPDCSLAIPLAMKIVKSDRSEYAAYF